MYLLGVILSLGASFSIACHHLLIRLGTNNGSSYGAVIYVLVINVVILIPIVSVVYYPNYELSMQSWLSFIGAGIFGTLVGRVCLYSSIDQIGASRTVPIVASWALVSTILGVLLLDETLSLMHFAGVLLVIGGVATIAWETSHENPDNLPKRKLYHGLLLPFGAALALGVEPILASFGFAVGTPPLVGLTIRSVAALVGFCVFLWWRDIKISRIIFKNDTRWLIAAGVFNTLFIFGYYSALEINPVSVVTPLIVTYTIFVVLLSFIFMPERLEKITWLLVLASILVMVGIIIISIYGN